ncbi:MAG TPA: hypothetical protein ENI85_03475 [Deltaproteobacteria bacterium]|nr:hypothetical protein [Deltaproteobacteria bacterium]
MKTPASLEPLIEHGIIQEVVRPLMSGKEAQVFVVRAGGTECVAKVYKAAHERTFRHRAEYTEGRRSRNTRDQRAVLKRSRHGRKRDEAAWRSAEVDTIHRLREAGVRVPEPINFVEGVLVMELVRDAGGEPAPRLGDLVFEADEAFGIYRTLIREVVRMLCAGVIHGDLSEFNVLMAHEGPVVIDFPQSVDPARNLNARKLLLRDVENLHRFLRRFAPERPIRPLGEEIWALYEKNRLRPDTELRGNHRAPRGRADTRSVMAVIEDVNRDERARREAHGRDVPAALVVPGRTVVDFTRDGRSRSGAGKLDDKGRRRPARKCRRPASSNRPGRSDGAKATGPSKEARDPAGPGKRAEEPAKRRRARRRRKPRSRPGNPD